MEATLGERTARLEVTVYGNGDKEAALVSRVAKNRKDIDTLNACVEPAEGCLEDRVRLAVIAGIKASRQGEGWVKYLLEWVAKLGPTIVAITGFMAVLHQLKGGTP